VRLVLITMPSKQGKSTLAAAIWMTHLCGPMVESRGQIYSAAPDRQQSSIIFNELLAMIDRRPALAESLHVQRWNKDDHARAERHGVPGAQQQCSIGAPAESKHSGRRSRSGDRRSSITTWSPAWRAEASR
jgi:phage terminase large subunit-like protein